ncbi:MAG: DNA polymerase III subunit delta' [Eubacterium sp.]|jgi:DNA polymerase III, delta' subunit|nr:DNA polymerase III subunit delta' [Eubacterium sp.]
MFSFSEIVGHEQIKEHMQAAIRDKKPFHAYLFQGEEGVGKEALARTFAAGLQCQSESADKPCKECVSCHQMESGNQPDVIWVTREKASLGVDEIREQLCNTMDIKPFSSPYKIYLVPEAEKMTEAAQNALLKTIEEPPEYGIVILMTSNISALLPTIQSRCLTMEFRPLSTAVVESYVKEHCQVPDYQARASAAFAQGNLGKAMRYAKSEDFIERKDHIISLLRHVEQMDLSEMLAVIKDLGTRKDEVRDYIDLMVLWYRDVLLFKATKDINQLLFQDEASYISREASHRSYEKIEEILQAFEKAKVRLRANVNFDITMELMLLTLK